MRSCQRLLPEPSIWQWVWGVACGGEQEEAEVRTWIHTFEQRETRKECGIIETSYGEGMWAEGGRGRDGDHIFEQGHCEQCQRPWQSQT